MKTRFVGIKLDDIDLENGEIYITLEQLKEMVSLVEKQCTTDKEEVGTKIVNDNFEYTIDNEEDVYIEKFR